LAEISTIAVIGAGVLGREIAHQAALAGYDVILEDVLPNALRRAEREILSSLDQAVEMGIVPSIQARFAAGRLQYAGNVEEAAREADLVVEAVPEELESKIEIFTLLDKICRPHTVLVSSTSTLGIAEIASVTFRASRCIGMRFIHPVHAMKSLQIVRGPQTDDETAAAATEIARRMKKEVIVVTESTGAESQPSVAKMVL